MYAFLHYTLEKPMAFDEDEKLFERKMSLELYYIGLRVAYLPELNFQHAGTEVRCHSSRSVDID